MRRIIVLGVILLPLIPLISCTKDKYQIDMVTIEGGVFSIGSDNSECDPDEKPVHEVVIKTFNLGRYEVTQKQWVAVVKKNPSFFKGENLPVECVSVVDIERFIRRLNNKTGRKYRLPTEEEWEYAAQGGKYHITPNSDSLHYFAWYIKNSDTVTHEVGSLEPNLLGLYDMQGNVHEWCSGFYDSLKYIRYVDSGVTALGITGECICRGGSFFNETQHLRITNRNHIAPNTRNFSLGFRLAESVEK